MNLSCNLHTMTKVLLVEDEKNFALVLRDYLRMNGFEVIHAENGEEGLTLFLEQHFDLCILDIMMPKKDGFSLSIEMQTHKKEVPFLFLSARTLREDQIKAYRLGAEDYILKPFDSELLLLKIKAILNRGAKKSPEGFLHAIGEYTFNSSLRLLKHRKGEEFRLSPKESALLHLLCIHKNEALPREKALKHIWKEDTYFTGRSMDVYIVKLRKYLSLDSGLEIKNLHGSGFSLEVKHEEV